MKLGQLRKTGTQELETHKSKSKQNINLTYIYIYKKKNLFDLIVIT